MTQALIRPGQLYAWAGGSLLITDARGRCGENLPLSGYYFREARYLSRCGLLIDGEPPWLCEAAAISPVDLSFIYTYPEVANYGGGGSGQSGDDVPRNAAGIAQRALEIQLTYEIAHGRLAVHAGVTNRSREVVRCEIAWELDADFADIQEAQAARREQSAAVSIHGTPREIVFRYGHARLPFQARVQFATDVEWQDTARRAARRVALEPGEQTFLELAVHPFDGAADPAESESEREDHVEQWRRSFTRPTSPRNRVFEAVVSANVRDVASFPLLDGPRAEWLALQAGVPLYPAFFGRDALTAGWQAAMIDRGQALDAALTRLRRFQSNRVDDWRDAEPGRVPYQMRTGPLALLGINPYDAYYADYASPLMFVIALANLFAWTGDRSQLDRHWDAARRILDWARDYGDKDRDGYLEYQTRSPKGTKNQGWKDSGDAIVYDDGSPVPAPISTCELQGYWYAAQQLMALLCAARGEWTDARAHFAAASDLKARFNRDWWSEREQFFALAMDPDNRLIEAPTSNVGHCLATGIIDRGRLHAVVGRMFAPDMFSGWGIRTLSAEHPFYDPLSYHRGTVWAVEQATILFGLRRFGFNARVHDLAGALFELAQLYPQYRIPECVGGYSRRERPTPGAYPQANAPQLWNASAFPLLVQSLLGIVPWAAHGLLVVDPILPVWLPDIVLHDLRVGGACVTLRFERKSDGASDFEVVQKHGPLRIVRQPPPQSVSAGIVDRLSALVESFM